MADFLKNFRDQLLCRKCEKIPKPENSLMRCSSCKELLCNECCGRKCPLCRHRSKDSKISTFIEQTELTKLLSSYKTRPCPNFKKGCLEEVSIKSDEWKVHEQNCIFQMVPCPKMNCKEILVFTEVDEHLKQAHKSDAISIYFDTEANATELQTISMIASLHQPTIYGVYHLQTELVNGRNYYMKKKHVLWFTEKGNWKLLGHSKGKVHGLARIRRDVPFPDSTTNWDWQLANSIERRPPYWIKANKEIGVKGIILQNHSK